MKAMNISPEGYEAELMSANVFDRLPLQSHSDNLGHGAFYAANASRFVEDNFQTPLTQYANAWRDNDNLDATLEFIAPAVQTAQRFEYATFPNAEAFMSDASAEDLRGIGSDFGRVEYTSDKVTARVANRGLTIRIDDDQIENMANWQEFYVGRLMARLKRNEIRRAFALLIAAATNNAKTWDTTALKDPDQDVLTARIAYRAAVGMAPNRILFTDGAWNKRGISHRAQNTAGGFASAQMTPTEAGQFFGSEVYVSGERYQSGASSKTLLAGSNEVVLLYMAAPGATPQDPSNIKLFWSPCPNSGQRFAVYVTRFGSKFTDITVEHYSLSKVTSTLGIQSLTIS